MVTTKKICGLVEKFKHDKGFSLLELCIAIAILGIGFSIFSGSYLQHLTALSSVDLGSYELEVSNGIKGIIEQKSSEYLNDCRTIVPANGARTIQSFNTRIINEPLGALGVLGRPDVFEDIGKAHKDYSDALQRCNKSDVDVNPNSSSAKLCYLIAMRDDFIDLLPRSSITSLGVGLIEMRIDFIDFMTLQPTTCNAIYTDNAGAHAGINLRYVVHWKKELSDKVLKYKSVGGFLFVGVGS